MLSGDEALERGNFDRNNDLIPEETKFLHLPKNAMTHFLKRNKSYCEYPDLAKKYKKVETRLGKSGEAAGSSLLDRIVYEGRSGK